MIVKQVSFDIEAYYENLDVEDIVLNVLKQNGIEVLGSSQIDVSDLYNYDKTNISNIKL